MGCGVWGMGEGRREGEDRGDMYRNWAMQIINAFGRAWSL